MSTDESADIFYQVKKQILDKLDLILQKINLQIINSKQFKSKQTNEDFTFIQLSQFQSEISTLFVYLDKLYDSLNSSVSGYTSPSMHHHSHTVDIHSLYIQLQQQHNNLKSQHDVIKQLLQQANAKLTENTKKSKLLKQKLKIAYSKVYLQPQQLSMDKKWISGKLKQFKFEMLQARVQILTKIKQMQALNKQMTTNMIRQDAIRIKQKEQIFQRQRQRQRQKINQYACHRIGHDQMEIINQINQILKMC